MTMILKERSVNNNIWIYRYGLFWFAIALAFSGSYKKCSVCSFVPTTSTIITGTSTSSNGGNISIPKPASLTRVSVGSNEGRPSSSPAQAPSGPPPQTFSQKLLEKALDFSFRLLYLKDDIGLQDSSKNLRVLWTRALLDKLNKIEDRVAYQLLPKSTRSIAIDFVGAKLLPKGVIDKLDWIVQRTNFIDGQLDQFLNEASREEDTEKIKGRKKCQVLLLGSGYDTRCLRYTVGRDKRNDDDDVNFYVVDLPDVIENSSKIINRYLNEIDEKNTEESATTKRRSNSISFIEFDLNESVTKNKSLIDELSKNSDFVADGSIPTMIICEAVLFYLIPDAAQMITKELFDIGSNKKTTRYCFTDNLSKVGVKPGGGQEGPPPIAAKSRCKTWLESNEKELVDHDSIWGGAIHFCSAK